MLTEKHYKLIEYLVSGDHTITSACKEAGFERNAYYYLLTEKSPTGKAFVKAYNEALDLKVKESRKFVKARVNELLNGLLTITKNGKNENAKVNAVAKLLHYAELDPSLKQDININSNTDNANELLQMWKQKQDEQSEDKE